jgi:hypothetical protein
MQYRFNRFHVLVGILIMLFVVGIMPAFASGPTLPTIDPSPIFDAIGIYLPWVFGILAIPAGIVLSVNLAQFIIGSFKKAFSGGGGK